MALEQVADRIYKIPSILGPRRFAQWLVLGDERRLLVDSGVDGTVAEHIEPALASLGLAVTDMTDVIISHADVDHYGGNAALKAAHPAIRIVAHAHDRDWLEHWDVISAERYGWYRGHGLDYDEGTWAWLRDAAGPDTPIDGVVADGDRLDLGGIEVEVVGLPGHSPGHLGVVHRASGTAIVMDAVLERGLYTTSDTIVGPPPYGSVADYRSTIRTLQELAPERLGTSHYAAIEGRTAVDRFLAESAAFVDDLDRVVRERLDATPRPLTDFWAPANEAVGPFPEMAVELARSVGAHLDAAVAAGSALRDDDARPRWRAA